MNVQGVMALLEKNKNERGIAHWKRLTGGKKGTSYGIGLSQLRKLAKQVGRDHELSLKLWASGCYDAKVIAALIDEPAKMTRAQVEKQVDELNAGMMMMVHVYCSCDPTLAKTSFVRELAVEWIESKDDHRRRCGYLLLAELSRNKKDATLTDAFFEKYIARIEKGIKKEENWVRDAMNTVIFGVGQRNAKLNKRALAAAKKYWPIQVDYGDNSCEPVDVIKHLTGPHIQAKVAQA